MPVSSKNFSMSPAAADLGLGDQLQQQAQQQIDALKKKKGLGALGQSMANDLMSPAAQALLGQTKGNTNPFSGF